LKRNPSQELVESIVDLALSEGFFSIWLTVFHDLPEMRQRFISSFPNTAEDCFSDPSTDLVSPRPNNGLPGAGKI
jgi:hypothetical protein